MSEDALLVIFTYCPPINLKKLCSRRKEWDKKC